MDPPQQDDDGFTLVQKKRSIKQAPIQKPQAPNKPTSSKPIQKPRTPNKSTKSSPNKRPSPKIPESDLSEPLPQIEPEDWLALVFGNSNLVKYNHQGSDCDYNGALYHNVYEYIKYSIPIVLEFVSVGDDTITAKPQNHGQLVELKKLLKQFFDHDDYTSFQLVNDELVFNHVLREFDGFFDSPYRRMFKEPFLIADCFIKHAKCGDGFSEQFIKFYTNLVESDKFRGEIDDFFWFVALTCMKESYGSAAGRVRHRRCRFGIGCHDFRAKHLVEFSH